MTAAILDLQVEAGATFERTLIWQDPAGTPVDLTGWSARAQVRPTARSAQVLADLTSAPGGGITLGAAPGRIDLVIAAEDTATFPADAAVWDLLLVSPSRTVRLVRGKVEVLTGVTR